MHWYKLLSVGLNRVLCVFCKVLSGEKHQGEGWAGYWVRGGQVWEKPERANLLLVREDWDVIES